MSLSLSHVIELLLNAIEPLIYVNNQFFNPVIHLFSSDMVPGNLFAGAVQQDADAPELIEFALEQKSHESHDRCQNYVPYHHFHD
jgi:hypothetical protein